MSVGSRKEHPRSRCRGLKAVALGAALVLSACLVGVALALPGASWLTWFALLPLFLSIRVQTPVRAMVSGGVWGLCVFVFSVTAVDTAVAPTARSLCLLVATPAVYAWLASLLTRWIGFAPLVLAYGWIGVEFALTPLGLRSGLLVSAQGEGVLAGTVGRLLGYVFVAFLIACANASVLSVLTRARLILPRQSSLIALPDRGAYCAPQTFLCFQRFAHHQAYPRAPPTRVVPMT